MKPTHAADRPSDQDGRRPKGEGWASPGTLKWVVIGVIVLAFLGLFRAEISRFLDRIGSIEVEKGKIEIRTVQTPLGRTEVSSVTITPAVAPVAGIHGTTYVSDRYGFQISWPDNAHWTADESVGATLLKQLGGVSLAASPVVIFDNELVGNFRPNVNVVVEPAGNTSIHQAVDQLLTLMGQSGWQVISSELDESTQSALVVVLNPNFGGLYQIQRFVIASGRFFTVTASQLPPEDQLGARLRADLLSILNSFRLLKSV
jgi:hypothetical protein